MLDLFWEEGVGSDRGPTLFTPGLSLVVCWTWSGWGTFIFKSFSWDTKLDLSLVVCWTCVGWSTFTFNSCKWHGEFDLSLVVCWTSLEWGTFYIQQLRMGWEVGIVSGGVLNLLWVGHT